MQFTKALFSLFIIALFTFSCKKECKHPDPSVEGLWIGTYQSISDPNNFGYLNFIVKPGGLLTVESKYEDAPLVSYGTWNLTGTKFTGSYTHTGTTFTFTSDYESAGNLKNGTYGVSPDLTGDGTFVLSRVD